MVACQTTSRTPCSRRKQLKMCEWCGKEPARPRHRLCTIHAEKEAHDRKVTRHAKVNAGLCLYDGCNELANSGYKYCRPHQEAHRVRQNKQNAAKIAKGICISCTSPVGENQKRFCDYHWRIQSKQVRDYLQRQKNRVFEAYGGWICNCCGETTTEFLTIDHINNDGAQHRRQLNGKSMYTWLEKNDYPPGFQVLCMNCNWGKRTHGICPHQLTKNCVMECKASGQQAPHFLKTKYFQCSTALS